MPRKRYSVAEEKLKELGASVGVHYSDKTFRNIKMLLERYACLKQDFEHVDSGDAIKIWRLPSSLFKAMISANPISAESADCFVLSLLYFDRYGEMIEYSLERIVSFSNEGRVYCVILTKLYLGDEIVGDREAEKITGFSHGTYYVKKKYAIMLFGILMWSRILKHWRNSKTEMKIIESQQGRDGTLSQNLTEDYN